ncbi:MAG: glycosyltransferase family 2 protein [Verrucomicrobiota bacterium]
MSESSSETAIPISIVIPVFNESGNLRPLIQELTEILEKLQDDAEVILVDDGSSDDTSSRFDSIIKDIDSTFRSRFQLIRLRRNYGQTTAFMAGIDTARGEIMILMDGDLQNDPADIPRLLKRLDEGFDVVSGWRKHRKDPWFSKQLPSWIANRIISALSRVSIHDYGCSLKAYRRSAISGFRLYGEMHRFIPIYARWQGAKISEITVNHRPRVSGKSNYGLTRTFKVVMDLIVVIFLHEYQQKPMYVFGFAALVSLATGGAAGLLAFYYKFFGDKSLIQTPLPLLCVMCFLTAVMCFLMGLLAELLIRIYYESQDKRTYVITKTL